MTGAAVVLVLHSLYFNFVTDDAYISFVFARNLAEHGELVFNLGDPVEGYTNFLWTLMLAAGQWLGIAPEAGSLVLAAGFAIGTLVVSARLCRRVIGEASGWELLVPYLLAVSSSFACWTSGGLETQLFAFWLVLAFDSYVAADTEARWQRRTGVYLALAAMTRPEGLLIAGLLAVHRYAVNAIRDRRFIPHVHEWSAIAGFLALWMPYFAWRWWYYGYPFPNTYYVKAAGEVTAQYKAKLFDNGFHYVGQWAKQVGLWYALGLMLIALVRSWKTRVVFSSAAALTTLVYLAYTAKVGGDFMGLFRFVLPLLPVLAVLTVVGLRDVSTLAKPRWVAPVIAYIVLAGFGQWQFRQSREAMRAGNWKSDNGIDTPSYLEIYTDDRARIGKHMRSCFAPDDFSIVGGAGAQPYFGRMRGIDVFGLVSEDIAHNVKPTRPRAGHNKWAPDSLLAKYEPEFVFSCYSIHKEAKKPRLNCRPGFWLARGYRLATLHIPGLRQQGEYYTFLVRKDRDFSCPGLLP